MKTIFQYLLLTAACAALGACQDFSDDTAFTPETPELSFVETSITAEKATKDYELSIKSNLPWRIECDKDWVSFDPSYGQGDATITVTVAANRTLDERTATISAYVIKGENVTLPVTQAAASASDLATHYYVKTDGSADKDGLTWETATTLANAIDQAMNGDVIHVAAGSYVPSVPLTGMKTALDNTFEIHSNFSMIGGYPADAAEGAVADPVANETILDGDHAVCHVVAVTAAKMNGMKASLDGFTIKNGSSQFSTVGSTTIGGVKFYQSYGAGIFIGNATVDILNCKIVDNTDIRMGAIRVDAGAEALFDNCVVADNATKSTTTYNCGGLWADGAKLLRINNCTFSNNKASGVAPCIYVFGDTGGKTNVLISNTTISGNSVNPEHATRNGGGIYVRENGNLVIVNSTVCGNHSGKGGGIAVYGKVDKPSKAVIVSCTIAGNTTVTAGNGAGLQQAAVGGAIEVYNTLISGNTTDGAADDVAWFKDASYKVANSIIGAGLQQAAVGGAIEVYNTLISGNTTDGAADDVAWFKDASYKVANSIIGGTVYNADGMAVAGAAFDPASMLSPLGDNGGATKTCVLLGDANPARQYGMSASELKILGETLDPAFGEAVSAIDQTGASRTGKTVIGAVVK